MNKVMNPIIYEMLMAFVRNGATIAGTWLVTKGFITEGDQEKVVGGLIMLVVTLASIAWTVYQKRIKLLAALAAGEGTTEHEIEAIIKNPAIVTPPATKPKDSVPYLDDLAGTRSRQMKPPQSPK